MHTQDITRSLYFGLDQESNAFITIIGMYCYKVMPFSHKNVGATYQRLVTKMFRDEIRKYMEVYVDDMLVKRKRGANYIFNLSKTFEILRH